MKVVGIYKITSPCGKIYIGQSVDCISRFKCYKRYSCKSQKKLHSSLVKYGAENHLYEIIEECDLSNLSEREKYYVDNYNTFDSENGLNIRDGGGNSAKLSDDQKRKISESLKGVKHSEYRKEKNRHGQLGKKLSESHKANISLNNAKSNLGKKASAETIEKLRLSHIGNKSRLGIKHSEKTKKMLSLVMQGENNPNFGKARSVESKNKISESLKKYWNDKRKQNS